MMEQTRLYAPSPRQKTASALASFLIVGAGATALVLGLAGSVPSVRAARETLVSMTPSPVQTPAPRPSPSPTPSPIPTQAERAESSRPKGAASPENLRNRATEVFAPVLAPIRRPPPIVAAPRPATGSASNTGAADRVGPGQGAGGVGDGTGGGGDGGNGNSYGDAVTRPRQIAGRLRWSDLPRELREARQGGELELTYRVNVDGHVSDCRVVRSSGRPALDVRTCQLITERFRFRPSRDAAGRPVPSYIIELHGWDDPEPDEE